MKRLYFSLIATIAFVGFAALALADPGTTWDQQINGHHRFKVLREFDGAAVLDKETGSSRRAQTLSVGRHPPTVPAPGRRSPSSMRSVTDTS